MQVTDKLKAIIGEGKTVSHGLVQRQEIKLTKEKHCIQIKTGNRGTKTMTHV